MVKKYIQGESKDARKLRKAGEKALQELVDMDQELGLIDAHPHNPLVKNQNYILCLKHGTKYSADYVNILYNMVARHCTLDYTFVCLTDNSTNLNPNILTLPLPTELSGWWCKPYMYSADLPLNGTILYMDLDVVISNNIDKLFNWNLNRWCTIRDFTRVQRPSWEKYNSSVVRFKTGELDFVWKDFISNSIKIQAKYHGDQDHLYAVTQSYPALTYPDNWIKSWKWEIRKSKQISRGEQGFRKLTTIENVQPSSECSICVFHGDPNPEHCEDPWVVENWK